MRSEWIETTVGAQATLQRGFDITRVDQRAGTVPVVSSGGVSSYHDTAAANGPGVILGRKGVVGSVYYIPSDYWPHDTTLWVKDFHGNEPRFVYYFFRWLAPRIATLDVGSANPTLNRNHVHPIEIHWPADISEQRAIAHVLGTLDDKIELNRRMNETLEAMAKAIFMSWFVDFDPVRAKAEGRKTGLPREIEKLFPDSFEDSELGEIPRGWRVKSLDEIATYLNGLALQKYPPTSDDYLPVIKIAELRSGITTNSGKASPEIPHKYIVEDGDVLFPWSGSLEVVIWCGGKGALNQHLFKVLSESYPKWFYYFWTLQHLPDFRLIAEGKATTMGHIQRRHLTEAKVVEPPSGMLNMGTEHIGRLLDLKIERDIQSRNLATIRDVLLPKLISGEIRIPKPKKVMGET
ncbi:MAG: restriction endonuclease subunit S [Planctomycetota bacterium]|jgi:type I restriction enzyme S subunit